MCLKKSHIKEIVRKLRFCLLIVSAPHQRSTPCGLIPCRPGISALVLK